MPVFGVAAAGYDGPSLVFTPDDHKSARLADGRNVAGAMGRDSTNTFKAAWVVYPDKRNSEGKPEHRLHVLPGRANDDEARCEEYLSRQSAIFNDLMRQPRADARAAGEYVPDQVEWESQLAGGGARSLGCG